MFFMERYFLFFFSQADPHVCADAQARPRPEILLRPPGSGVLRGPHQRRQDGEGFFDFPDFFFLGNFSGDRRVFNGRS